MNVVAARSSFDVREVGYEIVGAVLRFAFDPSIADVARLIGRSESKTLRETDRLIRQGLLEQQRSGRLRQLRFNDSHPLAGAVRETVFLLFGVTRPAHGVRAPRAPQLEPPGESWRRQVGGYGIPAELVGAVADWQVDSSDWVQAPGLVQVRAVVLELRAAELIFERLRQELDETFYRWRDERARDFVHFVGDRGNMLQMAEQVLTAAAEREQLDNGAAVAPEFWAAATFLVAHEIEDLEVQARWLTTGIDLAVQRDRQQALLREAREQLTQVSRYAESDDPAIDPAAHDRLRQDPLARVEAAAEALATIRTQLGAHCGVGGRTTVEDVGGGMDRLLAVRLDQSVGLLRPSLDRLMAHPCFEAWLPMLKTPTSTQKA